MTEITNFNKPIKIVSFLILFKMLFDSIGCSSIHQRHNG